MRHGGFGKMAAPEGAAPCGSLAVMRDPITSPPVLAGPALAAARPG